MVNDPALTYTKDLISNFHKGNYLTVLKDVFLVAWTFFPAFIRIPVSNLFSLIFHLLSYIPYLPLVLIPILLLLSLRLILRIRKIFTEKYVLLEITPPANTEKSAYTTKRLFEIIHQELDWDRSRIDRLLGRKVRLSFEIVSSLREGIRYIVRVTPNEANNVKRHLLSFMSSLKIKEVEDYTQTTKGFHIKVLEFGLKKHFAYPLQKLDLLEEHDPIAFLTGMMTKISPGELISFQIVISPTRTDETTIINAMILNNENILKYLNRIRYPKFMVPVIFFFKIIIKIFVGIWDQGAWLANYIINKQSRTSLATSSYYGHHYQQIQYQYQMQVKPARTITPFEEETVRSVKEKIDQPLFEISLRLLAVVSDKRSFDQRTKGFTSTLTSFSVPEYQSLIRKNDIPLISNLVLDKLKMLSFKKRLLSLFSDKGLSILSASEVSSFYHFPFTSTTQTEGMMKSHSNELPVPTYVKQTKELDVIVGQNTYGGEITPVGLRLAERYRHLYILGATGTGKSTMLLFMIFEDIKNGKGLILVDPHGDLAVFIAQAIPKNRLKDVIYWNPRDIKHPIRLNLLQMTHGLEEDEAALEKEVIVEHIISIFRKVFSRDLSSAGTDAIRIEHIFRNALYTALELENPTLATVFDLLVDPSFRSQALEDLKNERLKNFWRLFFNKAGDMQRVSMTKGLNARIERFLFSTIAQRVMEKYTSTIDFEKIMDEGKILICNFSKGNLGDDNTRLFGTMVLGEIQLAALKRAEKDIKDRKDFYVYVDEFQNFATKSFIEMMAESRKYGVYIIIAEQSTSQQRDSSLVDTTFANVGTVVMFKNANPHDEQIVLPLFKPYLTEGEIAYLPVHKFYMKISAVNPQETFSGETILLNSKQDKKKLEEVIRLTRKQYAPAYEKPTPLGETAKKAGEKDKSGLDSSYIKDTLYLTKDTGN